MDSQNVAKLKDMKLDDDEIKLLIDLNENSKLKDPESAALEAFLKDAAKEAGVPLGDLRDLMNKGEIDKVKMAALGIDKDSINFKYL